MHISAKIVVIHQLKAFSLGQLGREGINILQFCADVFYCMDGPLMYNNVFKVKWCIDMTVDNVISSLTDVLKFIYIYVYPSPMGVGSGGQGAVAPLEFHT